MALSREAEELLFAAGLAEQEAAYGGGPSTYDLLRAATRKSTPRNRPTPIPHAPQQNPFSRVTPLPRAPRDRGPGQATPLGPAPLPNRVPRLTPLPGTPRQSERARAKPLVERPRLDSRSKIAGGVLDSFEEERQLRKRNDSLRRAFKAIPGGDEALATIEALVDAEHGTRRATGAPSVVRTLQRTLETDDDREREARIRAEAEKIPMGLDALDLFRRERELGSRNDAVRRALAGDGPRPVGSTSLLSADAEERLWDETLAHEGTLGGDRPSAYAALVQDERIWAEGLGPDEQASPSGGVSEYARLREDERVWEDQFAIEEQAANPRSTEHELESPPERLIAAYVRLLAGEDLHDSELSYLQIFSDETREEAAAIAEADRLDSVVGQVQSAELRGQQFGTDFDQIFDPVVSLGAEVLARGEGLARSGAGAAEDVAAELAAFLDAQRDSLVAAGEWIDRFGPTERTPHQIDRLRRELNALTGSTPGEPPNLRCLTAEGVERLHDGILAAMVTDTRNDPPGVADVRRARAFIAGIKGDVDPRGADYPLLRQLPEGSLPREVAGWGVEQATDPVFLITGPIGKVFKRGRWVARGLASGAVRELLTGGCED